MSIACQHCLSETRHPMFPRICRCCSLQHFERQCRSTHCSSLSMLVRHRYWQGAHRIECRQEYWNRLGRESSSTPSSRFGTIEHGIPLAKAKSRPRGRSPDTTLFRVRMNVNGTSSSLFLLVAMAHNSRNNPTLRCHSYDRSAAQPLPST